ncbi:hypothetical protein CMO91_02460 [Candidatus Woesearchaeota archaeon]|nr:hypothetical protein [Candidatus Woesearchaeota archaeon]|tara:strand:- start:717 stop:977 length:261 start_codon:yes stop_codon:yes gene_type:complete
METVSIKLEKSFLKDLVRSMKAHRYATKTEFIREAVRDKMQDLEKKEAIKRLDKWYGSSKRKTTDKQLHEAGERAVEHFERKFSIK